MKTICLFVFLLLLACNANKSPEEIKSKLISTMNDFLNKNAASEAKFQVESVIYYDDDTRYLCEFKVRLKLPGKDTTGGMRAYISKDFTEVVRNY